MAPDVVILGPPVQVKICGITNPADAETAIASGADLLGFNFYPRSPRFLAGGDLDWLRRLASAVHRVAVLVNPTTPEMAGELFHQGLVDSVQLHGDESEGFCRAVVSAGVPLTRALRVRDESSLVRPERFGTRALLLDASRPGVYGGTGERLDWGLAARFAATHPELKVILSGGLSPDNVVEAVRRVRPFAVDVASGVEAVGDPRRKDPARVRNFIQAAKTALG